SAALFEDAHDVAAAMAEYRKIAAAAKEFPDALRRMTELLRGQGRLGEAAALAEQALQKRAGDEDLLVLWADLEEKRGDPARAVARLEAALKAQPRSETLI